MRFRRFRKFRRRWLDYLAVALIVLAALFVVGGVAWVVAGIREHAPVER